MTTDNFKLQSLKTAMKNPKMATLIMDAIKAPVGSSKREQARNVLGSLSIAQRNNEQSKMIPVMMMPTSGRGQGGPKGQAPVMMMPPPPTPAPTVISLKPATVVPYEFSNPIVKSEPISFIPPKSSQINTQDVPPAIPSWWDKAKTAVKGFFGQGGALPSNLTYNDLPVKNNNLIQNLNPQKVSLEGLLSRGTGLGKPSTQISYPTATQQNSLNLPNLSFNTPVKFDLNAPVPKQDQSLYSGLNLSRPITSGGTPTFVGGAPSVPTINLKPPTQPKPTQDLSKWFAIDEKGTVWNKAQNKAYSTPEEFLKAATGLFGEPEPGTSFETVNFIFDKGWKPTQSTASSQTTATQNNITSESSPFGPGLDASGKATTVSKTGDPLVDYLLDSYGDGVGKNAFALGVMSDAKLLQSLFPGVPVDKIPVGASLVGQLNELADDLKKEYHITELGDALTDAVTRGVTLQDDLTAYVRGKDQFLNSVDKLLQNATSQYLDSSMRSDPFYSKSMKQYATYLTTLKGRTTQRYIDYLNTSITHHNGQLQQLQTTYDKAAEFVNTIYTEKSELTKEQYQQVKDVLFEMYDNVATKAALINGTSKEAVELQKSKYSMAKDILDIAKTFGAGAEKQALVDQAGSLLGLSNLDASQLTSKPVDYSAADMQIMNDRFTNLGTLGEALNDPTLVAKGFTPDIIARQFGEALASRNVGELNTDPTKFKSMYNDFRNESNQLASEIKSLKDNGQDTTSIEALKDNYELARDTGFLKAIEAIINSNVDLARKMLKSMQGYDSYEDWANDAPGWFNFKKQKDWEEYKPLIDLAEQMFIIAKANQDTDFSAKSASEIAAVISAAL
ncbi:hypothetical protein M0R04_06085 [Candidatus Dojkabacteria bacterium]|nr:hypothetical protein [Candidatus Dojkabacteria bacterium]